MGMWPRDSGVTRRENEAASHLLALWDYQPESKPYTPVTSGLFAKQGHAMQKNRGLKDPGDLHHCGCSVKGVVSRDGKDPGEQADV